MVSAAIQNNTGEIKYRCMIKYDHISYKKINNAQAKYRLVKPQERQDYEQLCERDQILVKITRNKLLLRWMNMNQ